jgi:putative acetyltransferase
MNEVYTIKKDDLTGPEVAALLEDHLREMALHSPPESIHALDLDALRKPEITFWSVWDKDELVGCGALKQLGAHHAEIKSMRTAPSHRGKGIAKQMLKHILSEAERRGITRLSLETGSMAAFDPARRLYSGFGFVYCDPFADYKEDPNSVFMTKEL